MVSKDFLIDHGIGERGFDCLLSPPCLLLPRLSSPCLLRRLEELGQDIDQAANDMGPGHWQHAMRELRPCWRPAAPHNDEAQEYFNALRDAYATLNDFDLSSDEAQRQVLAWLHGMSTRYRVASADAAAAAVMNAASAPRGGGIVRAAPGEQRVVW